MKLRCVLSFPAEITPESSEALEVARTHGAPLLQKGVMLRGKQCPGELNSFLLALQVRAKQEAAAAAPDLRPMAAAAAAQFVACKRGRHSWHMDLLNRVEFVSSLEKWAAARLTFLADVEQAQWRFRSHQGALYLLTPSCWFKLSTAETLRLEALPANPEDETLLSEERALAVLQKHCVRDLELRRLTPASILARGEQRPLTFPFLERAEQLLLGSSAIHAHLNSRFTVVMGEKGSGKTTAVLLLLKGAMKCERANRQPFETVFRGVLFDTNRGFIGDEDAARAAYLGATVCTPGDPQREEFAGTSCTLDLPGFCSALEEIYGAGGVLHRGGVLLVLEMLAVHLDQVPRYHCELERLMSDRDSFGGSAVAWQHFQARVLHPQHSRRARDLHAALLAYMNEVFPSAASWLVPAEETLALLARGEQQRPCLFKRMVKQLCVVPLDEIKVERAKIRVVRLVWFFLFEHLKNDCEGASRCNILAMPDAAALSHASGQTLLSSALHPPLEQLAADVRQLNALVFFDHPAGGRSARTRASDEEWARNACETIFGGAHGSSGSSAKTRLTDLNFLRADPGAQSARYRFGWGSQLRLSQSMEDLYLPKLEENLKMSQKVQRNFGAPGCLALATAATRSFDDYACAHHASASSLLLRAEAGEARSEEDAMAIVCSLLWASPVERLEYLWKHGCAFAQNPAQLIAAAAPLGLASELMGLVRTPSDGDAQLLRAQLSLPPDLLSQLSPGATMLPDTLRDLPWPRSAVDTHTRDPCSIKGQDLEERALLLRWPHDGTDASEEGAVLRVTTAAGECELEARTQRVRVSHCWCVQAAVVIACRKRRPSSLTSPSSLDAGAVWKRKKVEAAPQPGSCEEEEGSAAARRLLIARGLRQRVPPPERKEKPDPAAAPSSDPASLLSEQFSSESGEISSRSDEEMGRGEPPLALDAGSA